MVQQKAKGATLKASTMKKEPKPLHRVDIEAARVARLKEKAFLKFLKTTKEEEQATRQRMQVGQKQQPGGLSALRQHRKLMRPEESEHRHGRTMCFLDGCFRHF